MNPFFPDLFFGWVFYLLLVGITAIAAVVDLRKMVVPKWLTVPTLTIGLALNLARGAWLGYEELPTWAFPGENLWVGLLDGLLFSITGFLVAFGLFFVLWILGTCGGGDVKLCAALGAWIGPKYVVFVVIGTLGAVILISMCILTGSLFTQGFSKTTRDFSLRKGKKGPDKTVKPRKRLLTFSLPVALATAVVLMWIFRAELLPPRVAKGEPESGAQIHAPQRVS